MSAQWRSSKTRTTVPLAGDALEERAPGGEQLLGRRCSASRPSRASSAGSIQRALVGVGDVLARPWPRPRSRVVASSSVSRRPQRPRTISPSAQKRDPLAVGRRAAVVPLDGLDEAVDVLEELPGQAALADAGRAR